MSYKFIAVDMDGTLLDSNGLITENTVNAIRHLVKSGVIFTISTGRPIQGVEKYNSLLHLRGPVITYNGSMIVDAESYETLFERGLLSVDARRIFELGLHYDTTMCIWAGNQLYGNKLNSRMHDYKKLSGVEPIKLIDIEKVLDIGVTKILWYDDVDTVKKMMQELSDDMFSEVTYCTSKPTFLEFFNRRVSKSEAMRQIGQIYSIAPEEMIAIGDGLNDLSMIQYAGMGIAMANADNEVKNNAQYITTSNDDEGVLNALKRFFPGELRNLSI
ncbi:Cof-type HAD-IIB family hydrolase [Frisingicoccus caecimuris]|uniref:Cof subfamily protein (Haloacid dehalogenase superfamily)/HAD superfamily hydrolase (TIGR01484 family) n=1 Tax=Frisingicoccus caecimuris TaxID=1796636 RepID=A0A4V2SDV6_9FIRM|nr:Cof-type HAD-IIB family hydrolase [Frisingicoccus caecimuris]MCR1918241.1 Cof-type HAD-IIB family hydrolase [Frisingicoccus caecimuris]TCO85342.1 hypothetical protein EV212_10363 [Frisingicoccus caecimuris]